MNFMSFQMYKPVCKGTWRKGCLRYCNSSPDAQQPLHEQGYQRDTDPAAEPHKDRLTTVFYQLYNIGMQTDCPHRHNDKELAQLL